MNDVERAMKAEKATDGRRQSKGSVSGNGLYLVRMTWTVVQAILLMLRHLWSANHLTVLNPQIEILIY